MKHLLGWIEAGGFGSRPARGAWIETYSRAYVLASGVSRPARGAWIETPRLGKGRRSARVAPRAGRVD